MPLRVISCCTYLTEVVGVGWRPVDHDAHDFIKAVKGKPINGFAQVRCRGVIHRLDGGCRDLALELFAQMIADAGVEHELGAPCALLPVPNSRCSRDSHVPPRTLEQAQCLATELGPRAVVVDALRWSVPLPSTSGARGLRDAQSLFELLEVIAPLPDEQRRYVLVDDVVTSGGHLLACAAMLRECGRQIELAVVAGRTVRTQLGDPFAVRVELFPDFTPVGPWAA